MTKFPIAPEVCQECLDGTHVMHVITELTDFRVAKRTEGPHRILEIKGWAEDELVLEDLLRALHREYERMQSGCEACRIEAEIGTREIPHPVDRRLHTCVSLCFGVNAKTKQRCELLQHHEGLHRCTKDVVFEWADGACFKLDPPPKELK